MTMIPAGQFAMGSPDDEVGRDSGEGPQRQIRIRRFAIGRYDVTRAEWAAFASATHRPAESGCAWIGGSSDWHLDSTGSWRSLHFVQSDSHPVVCVTWRDAQDYSAWLSARTGHAYRLPSEAEWEYAARSGTTTAYPWGPAITHDQANYGADECCAGLAREQDHWEFTSPVGSFPPSAFGLFDMQGNVLQWLQDCLAPYDHAPTDGSPMLADFVLTKPGPFGEDMKGTRSCAYRIVRGGDWRDPPTMLRPAFRSYGPGPGATLATYRSGGVGFRVARSVE